jgi:peptidoglycan/xylan/chitin deacetylase (PgdA/CDA1 family)
VTRDSGAQVTAGVAARPQRGCATRPEVIRGRRGRRSFRIELSAAVVAALVLASGSAAGGRVLRLPQPLPDRTIELPILMYHRIGPLTPSLPAITKSLTVTPADFQAEVEWLSAHGYHAVSQLQAFEALEYGKPLPSKPVMITFDDGYRDVLWHAAPVLHRLHMPATAYIITDRVDGPDPSFLTWPELVRLEKLGFTIGSHTVHHLDLTSLSAADALSELADSKRTLEQHLGHPIQFFAYPAGRENPSVVALALKAGYVLAVTTQPGSTQSAQDPLTLHRYEVLDTTGVSGVASFVRSS